jgi:hypothetical protein
VTLGLMPRRSPEPFPEHEIRIMDGVPFVVLMTLTGNLLHHEVGILAWITYRPNRPGD